MVLDYVGHVKEDHPYWSLASIASTCKGLHRLVLPRLYSSIRIPAIKHVLLPLTYCLMKHPGIAQLVRHLICVNTDDIVQPKWQAMSERKPGGWNFPPDFQPVSMQWLTQSGLDTKTALTWKANLRDGQEDHLFSVAAQACPNLTELRVLLNPGMMLFPDCSLFSSDRWPWKSLKTVNIGMPIAKRMH